MSSPFPPRATSSLNLPVQLLAPPALPLLGDCFPLGSVDLGKCYLYSSALSRRAHWRTLLAMSLGCAGELSTLSFGIGYVTNNESVSNMIHAVGINTEQNNQDFFFFGLAGRLEDYQKGVL